METTTPKSSSNETILLRSKSKILVISRNAITKLSSEGPYTKILLDNGKEFLDSKPLTHFQKILPNDQFCRCHNSHLINLGKFIEYNCIEKQVILNGAKVPVAKRRLHEFLQSITKYFDRL